MIETLQMHRPSAARARRVWRAILAALAGLSMTACTVVREIYRPDPRVAPFEPMRPEVATAAPDFAAVDGSLWPTVGSYSPFADDKAMRRGDIVLVEVMQKNEGKKDATTETSRATSISARLKRFLGFEDDIYEQTDSEFGPEQNEQLIAAEAANDFKGEGSTERKDNLTATVSAVVTDVLNNGNLVIYGHQVVQLNSEASVLTVQGVVRPSDIDATNRINSRRIANARIEFDGSGVLTDKQHPGIGIRVLDWIWPF